MLLDVLVVSLIIGLLRGGKLTRLANLPLRRIELIILPFLIQYALVYFGGRGLRLLESWGVYLYIFSYSLLLVAIWYNKHIREMKILGAGIAINFIVILANGGEMPVSVEALSRVGLLNILPLLRSKAYVIHTVLTDHTRLKFLADVIPLPPPYPRPRVIGVGDIIMAIGLFILIQRGMLKKSKEGLA